MYSAKAEVAKVLFSEIPGMYGQTLTTIHLKVGHCSIFVWLNGFNQKLFYVIVLSNRSVYFYV